MWIALSKDEGAAIRELYTLSGRAAAIVGAALLDSRLGAIISSRFPVDGDTKSQLFRPSGPIGPLDTKAKMAYAFGIISKEAFQDVVCILEIRNVFAHQLSISTFSDTKIAPKCQKLKLVERHVFARGETSETTTPGVSPKMFIPQRDEHLQDPQQR